MIYPLSTAHSPESLAGQLQGQPGLVLLRSTWFESPQARYSFLAARPFLTFRSFGTRLEVWRRGRCQVQFGNPWRLLDALMARYEILDQADLPFPLGGCFGYWGYDLKNFVEQNLTCRASRDLDLPDCYLGFYDSVVVFDHRLDRAWVVATGLDDDGVRTESRAREQLKFWHEIAARPGGGEPEAPVVCETPSEVRWGSNLTRAEFIRRVERAQAYIRSGDIYQANLSQRLAAPWRGSGWEMFRRLLTVSPAPFAAFLDAGDFQLCSSSPEQFLRISGRHMLTRPIKGTRPRDADPAQDARLAYQLQTNSKELAELVMITDLLRNDLGRVCEFGSVQVADLARLERFAQVQHLVSTIEGRLRPELSHLAALAACFPGGSITGAPKIRAMQIIDELEPTTRGPYTGALGYVGFNQETQLSIIIRAAICLAGTAYFPVGAGIVADSVPEAEYEETLAKARGFLHALQSGVPGSTHPVGPRACPNTPARRAAAL